MGKGELNLQREPREFRSVRLRRSRERLGTRGGHDALKLDFGSPAVKQWQNRRLWSGVFSDKLPQSVYRKSAVAAKNDLGQIDLGRRLIAHR